MNKLLKSISILICLLAIVLGSATVQAKTFDLKDSGIIVDIPDVFTEINTKEIVGKDSEVSLKEMQEMNIEVMATGEGLGYAIVIPSSKDDEKKELSLAFSYLLHKEFDKFANDKVNERQKKRFAKNFSKSSGLDLKSVEELRAYRGYNENYLYAKGTLDLDGNNSKMVMYATARGERFYAYFSYGPKEKIAEMDQSLKQIVDSVKYTLDFKENEKVYQETFAQLEKQHKEEWDRTHSFTFFAGMTVGGCAFVYGMTMLFCSLVKRIGVKKFKKMQSEYFESKYDIKKISQKLATIAIFAKPQEFDDIHLYIWYIPVAALVAILYAAFLVDNVKEDA